MSGLGLGLGLGSGLGLGLGHGAQASSASGVLGSKPTLQPHVSLLGIGYRLPGAGGPRWHTTRTGSAKEMATPSKLTSSRCSPSPLCTCTSTWYLG